MKSSRRRLHGTTRFPALLCMLSCTRHKYVCPCVLLVAAPFIKLILFLCLLAVLLCIQTLTWDDEKAIWHCVSAWDSSGPVHSSFHGLRQGINRAVQNAAKQESVSSTAERWLNGLQAMVWDCIHK